MAAILLLCAGACVIPFIHPPSINTSFDSLTVQNQPINTAVTSSSLITSGSVTFWSMQTSPAPSNKSSGTSKPSLDANGLALNSVPAMRRLAVDVNQPIRINIQHAIHVVFHLTNKTTMLTPAAIERVKSVEDQVYALSAYHDFCLHLPSKPSGMRECRRPVSVTNFIYGSVAADGSYRPDGNSDVQQDPIKASQVSIDAPCLPKGFVWTHVLALACTSYDHRVCFHMLCCIHKAGSTGMKRWSTVSMVRALNTVTGHTCLNDLDGCASALACMHHTCRQRRIHL
jgi:hypothetical protein